jgi:indolepyruvate ferredoxin oxidoreductase beta subunit
MKKINEFNLVVAGIGGQGLLTLAGAIARAALNHGYSVRASELHGLSMRFGSIETHVRFGKKIYSPLVTQANADLIIALEPDEAYKACWYAHRSRTSFLLDSKPTIPTIAYIEKRTWPTLEQVKSDLKPFAKNIFIVDASDRARELTGSVISANVYLLGKAVALNLLPLKKTWLAEALKEVLPERVLETNLKLFETACRE